MAICWERADLLAFLLCCFTLCSVFVVVCLPVPFGVWGTMWNSIVSVLIIAFSSTFSRLSTPPSSSFVFTPLACV